MVEKKSTRAVGVGRVLIAVYGLLALSAAGRSVFQIATQFSEAPLAYSLSGLSALVYIVATVALIGKGTKWYRVAWGTISFEFVGVVFVGLMTIVAPEIFVPKSGGPHTDSSTVWTYFGIGYGFVPLVLPVLGMLWLYRSRPSLAAVDRPAGTPAERPLDGMSTTGTSTTGTSTTGTSTTGTSGTGTSTTDVEN